MLSVVVESYEGERLGSGEAGSATGLMHGRGTATFKGGCRYEGEWAEGEMHGWGTYTWPEGTTYAGQFTHNALTGRGVYTWPEGSTYQVCLSLSSALFVGVLLLLLCERLVSRVMR